MPKFWEGGVGYTRGYSVEIEGIGVWVIAVVAESDLRPKLRFAACCEPAQHRAISQSAGVFARVAMTCGCNAEFTKSIVTIKTHGCAV